MTLRSTRLAVLAAGSAAALFVSGCGGTAASSSDGSDRLSVLAGFYPLEWAAARVGGDLVSVSSLTPPGAEAHDLELTPQDVAAVSEADLLVYIEGFQAAVDAVASSEAGDSAWNAGQAADLILTTEGHTDGEHADEEAHAEEETHADGEEIADPHFWLDPTRLADVAEALAERMAELDPDNADRFAENAEALRSDLEELDGEMQETLANCEVDTLVTSHDAFGYLGDRYGFEVVGISGLEPSEEPSPSELAEIAELVGGRGVTTIYSETLIDPAIAETVADEAGVQTAVLDPLEGLTDESAGDDYLAVMRANAATLQQGQSCA